MKHLENMLIRTIAKFDRISNQLKNSTGDQSKRLFAQQETLRASIKRINDEMDTLNAK
jgi:hypothetical protein